MGLECWIYVLMYLDNDESTDHTVDSGPNEGPGQCSWLAIRPKSLEACSTRPLEETCRKQHQVICRMCRRVDATRYTFLRFANGQRQEPQQDNGDSWLRERKQPCSKRLRRLRRVRLLFRAKAP
jgi:hypothetical protein